MKQEIFALAIRSDQLPKNLIISPISSRRYYRNQFMWEFTAKYPSGEVEVFRSLQFFETREECFLNFLGEVITGKVILPF